MSDSDQPDFKKITNGTTISCKPIVSSTSLALPILKDESTQPLDIYRYIREIENRLLAVNIKLMPRRVVATLDYNSNILYKSIHQSFEHGPPSDDKDYHKGVGYLPPLPLPTWKNIINVPSQIKYQQKIEKKQRQITYGHGNHQIPPNVPPSSFPGASAAGLGGLSGSHGPSHPPRPPPASQVAPGSSDGANRKNKNSSSSGTVIAGGVLHRRASNDDDEEEDHNKGKRQVSDQQRLEEFDDQDLETNVNHSSRMNTRSTQKKVIQTLPDRTSSTIPNNQSEISDGEEDYHYDSEIDLDPGEVEEENQRESEQLFSELDEALNHEQILAYLEAKKLLAAPKSKKKRNKRVEASQGIEIAAAGATATRSKTNPKRGRRKPGSSAQEIAAAKKNKRSAGPKPGESKEREEAKVHPTGPGGSGNSRAVSPPAPNPSNPNTYGKKNNSGAPPPPPPPSGPGSNTIWGQWEEIEPTPKTLNPIAKSEARMILAEKGSALPANYDLNLIPQNPTIRNYVKQVSPDFGYNIWDDATLDEGNIIEVILVSHAIQRIRKINQKTMERPDLQEDTAEWSIPAVVPGSSRVTTFKDCRGYKNYKRAILKTISGDHNQLLQSWSNLAAPSSLAETTDFQIFNLGFRDYLEIIEITNGIPLSEIEKVNKYLIALPNYLAPLRGNTYARLEEAQQAVITYLIRTRSAEQVQGSLSSHDRIPSLKRKFTINDDMLSKYYPQIRYTVLQQDPLDQPVNTNQLDELQKKIQLEAKKKAIEEVQSSSYQKRLFEKFRNQYVKELERNHLKINAIQTENNNRNINAKPNNNSITSPVQFQSKARANCTYCNRSYHNKENCFLNPDSRIYSSERAIKFRKDWDAKNNKPITSINSMSSTIKDENIMELETTVCSVCLEPDHTSSECTSTRRVRLAGIYTTGIAFGVQGVVNGHKIPIIYFDDGAMVNIVDQQFLEQNQIPLSSIQFNNQEFTLGDNMTTIRCKGTIELDVTIGEHTRMGKILFHIIENNSGNVTLGSATTLVYGISKVLDDPLFHYVRTKISNEIIELLIIRNGKPLSLSQLSGKEHKDSINNSKDDKEETDDTSEKELSSEEESSDEDEVDDTSLTYDPPSNLSSSSTN
jgi:hypothetical protein